MNIKKIRSFFPVLKNVIYLNTGTSGPMPLPVMNAIEEYLDFGQREGQASPGLTEKRIALNLRKKAAAFLKSGEDEICFTHSTSHGLGIVFSGIDWKEGDEIIVAYPEYISGMLNCQNVEKRYGVKLKIAETDKDGYIIEDELIKEISDKTKLILVSHINYYNGQRLNIKKLAEVAWKRDIFLLADGAQSAGAIDINLKGINPHFYVFPAQKWLLSEEGMGVLYINKNYLNKIKPSVMGYMSVSAFSPEGHTLHSGARRFEISLPGHALYFAFSAALDFYNMIGEETIFSRIEKLTDYLKHRLGEIKGLNLITPLSFKDSGGLVSFTIEGADYGKIVNKLYEDKKIIIRSIPLPKCLRASVHYFNTEEEMDIVAESIERII